ncbi:MAG: preprotein translocase subunit SecE [Bdellovibrionota bacterium]
METQYKKWVSLSYLGLAVLVSYIVSVMAAKIVGVYDLETRIRNIDWIVRALSLTLGGIVFFVLYLNDKVNGFMNEVMVELSRVAWPTQKETSSATLVVIVMVIITGLLLGFLDYLWTLLINGLLKITI